MKSYTAPRLTALGTVEDLTLQQSKPSGGGVTWIKPGTSNDPGGSGMATKVK